MKSEEISCLDRLSLGTCLVCSGCSQEADIDQREAVVEKYAKEAIFDNNYWRKKMRTPRWSRQPQHELLVEAGFAWIDLLSHRERRQMNLTVF